MGFIKPSESKSLATVDKMDPFVFFYYRLTDILHTLECHSHSFIRKLKTIMASVLKNFKYISLAK